jgi:hypothetical protein
MINSLQKYKIVKKKNLYGGVVPEYIDVLTKDISDILSIILKDEKLFKNVKKSLYKLLEARPLLFMDPFKWKTMNKRVEKKKDLDPKIRAVFVLLDSEVIDLEELNKLLAILVNYILDSNILKLISKLSISHFGVEESVITSSDFKLSIFYSEVYSIGLNELLKEVIKEFLKELEDFYKKNPDPDKNEFKNFFINLCERFEKKPHIGVLFRNMANSISMIYESHQESHQESNVSSSPIPSPRSNTSIDPTNKPFDIEKYKEAFAKFNNQPQPSPPQPQSSTQPSPPQPQSSTQPSPPQPQSSTQPSPPQPPIQPSHPQSSKPSSPPPPQSSKPSSQSPSPPTQSRSPTQSQSQSQPSSPPPPPPPPSSKPKAPKQNSEEQKPQPTPPKPKFTDLSPDEQEKIRKIQEKKKKEKEDKKNSLKQEAPKKEAPKKEAPKKEAPKKEAPKPPKEKPPTPPKPPKQEAPKPPKEKPTGKKKYKIINIYKKYDN